MKIRFYLEELIHIFKKSISDFIFLAVIYFLTLLIFSTLTQFYVYLSGLQNESFKVSFMKIFFEDEAPPEVINTIKVYAECLPAVDKVVYVSKEMAKVEFAERFPKYSGLLSIFQKSPFPQNIELRFNEKSLGNHLINDLTDFFSRFPFVSNVQHNYTSALQIYRLRKSIILVGFWIFVSFLILYIPLNLSFMRSIFAREKKLFDLVEYLGYEKRGLEITFVVASAIPLVLVSFIILAVFNQIAKMLHIPFYPVYLLLLFFLLLQLIFSVDVLEK
uniref:FtsX extracellular domain-containing protein n=1 Tax=candidate division WOR-3 bacterium TaxID=2052148 RepID=A0A7V4E5N5_UNCW3